MKTKILSPTSALTATYVTAIKEKRVHRGKRFLYAEDLPPWEVHNASMLALAQRTSQRTDPPHAFSLVAAALAWGVPTYKLPLRLDVIYFDKQRRGPSKVGEEANQGGIPVRRHNRSYPPQAIVELKGLPVLDYPYLLLELLQLPNPKTALVTADALARKVLGVQHVCSERQRKLLTELQLEVIQLAETHLSAASSARIRRRVKQLNPLAESPLESIVRVDLLRAGVVGLVAQYPLFSEGGQFYADLCVPAKRVVIECDGQEKYVLDPDKTQEAFRQSVIESQGFRVVRVSWRQAQRMGYVYEVLRVLGLEPLHANWKW